MGGTHTRAHGRWGRAGFTLTESLVALVVLSVAGLAAASTVVVVINGTNVDKRLAVATMLAQNQLEGLKYLPLTDPTLTAGPHTDPGNPLVVSGGGSYTRTWTVTDLAAPAGMKAVTVSVQWRGSGLPHVVQLTTMSAP